MAPSEAANSGEDIRPLSLRHIRGNSSLIDLHELDSFLKFLSGIHGLSEELGRHRGRERHCKCALAVTLCWLITIVFLNVCSSIQQMMIYEPSKRVSAMQSLNHPYFKNVQIPTITELWYALYLLHTPVCAHQINHCTWAVNFTSLLYREWYPSIFLCTLIKNNKNWSGHCFGSSGMSEASSPYSFLILSALSIFSSPSSCRRASRKSG